MSHWNWVLVRLADQNSFLGPGFPTREEAIAATDKWISQLEAVEPKFAPLAAIWRAGTAPDDTVGAKGNIIAIYPYDGSAGDMQDQGDLWVVDFATRAGAGIKPS